MEERQTEEGDGSQRNDDQEPIFSRDSMDISNQIGRALEMYSPFFIRKLNETLEGAMNEHIAKMIRDEVAIAVQTKFLKRDSEGKGEDGKTVEDEVEVTASKSKFNYKDFQICHPPEFLGESDPIICTRWISEMEGAFRTCQCPQDLKVVYAVSMLRDHAKRWWDSLLTVRKEENLAKVEWSEFKDMFFKEFRSIAEVTKLRGEFLNDNQDSMSVNEFRVKFLNKAQFCPEFLENDTLL